MKDSSIIGLFRGFLAPKPEPEENKPAWDNEDFQEMEDDFYEEMVDDDDNELY